MSENKTNVILTMEKETKNTVRFEEEVHDATAHPVLRTLYITKPEYAKLGSPARIQVTISVLGDDESE